MRAARRRCSRSSSASRSSRARPRRSLAIAEATRLVESRAQGSFRPLARRRSRRRAQACSTASSSAPRSGCASASRRSSRARPRRASCACPASSPTAAATTPQGTEIFLVEGDCAGGSAKQARDRETQAILPLRGKILNVASASADKLRAEPGADRPDPGAGLRHAASSFDEEKLRYERVIIMTDADVDGAHIASLLMTFFYREMPELIENGHLFLAHAAALPPDPGRHRSSMPATTRHKDELMKTVLQAARARSRSAASRAWARCRRRSCKETTMDPRKRTLLRVDAARPDEDRGDDTQDRRAGREPDGPQAGAALRVHPGEREVRARSGRVKVPSRRQPGPGATNPWR